MAGCRRLIRLMDLDPRIGVTVLADSAVGHPSAGPLWREVARLQGNLLQVLERVTLAGECRCYRRWQCRCRY